MTSPFETTSTGEKVGKHPEKLSVEGFHALAHQKTPLLKIMRQKCMDCCCHQAGEVRKCVSEDCELWPYRMGTNPFRSPKTLSDKQKGNLFKDKGHE